MALPLNNIGDLLPFLNYLKDKHLWYRLEHLRDDGIMVMITLVGMRVEVEFLEEWVEYSIFSGDESVLSDHKALFDLLEEYGG